MVGAAPDNAFTLSSSGYSDGLGRRVLEIDRETGDMLERLVLRPELYAFEPVLRERVARASKLQDEHFSRPRAVARDDEQRLTVVSHYVAGRRLSDAIETAAAAHVIAGLDAGIGFLLELLPALGALHGMAGYAHGCLAPGRLVVSPAGKLIVLDWVYGSALERLRFTRQRLWGELRVAPPPTAGASRLDVAGDLTQATMIAASLTISRPLGDRDYPAGIAALRAEILEVALIRGSKAFASGVEKFFDRLLPSPARRPFSSADEAVVDLRQLVRREIGLDACRTAWIEFLQQVDAADTDRGADASAAPAPRAESQRHARDAEERAERERRDRERREVERKERERVEAERKARERLEAERREQERLEAERQEKERLEAERLRERIEAERRELARLEAERKERERLEAERRAREEAERQERDRLERERIEAERKERERREAERRAREEAERLEKERLERERIEAERKERERLEKERREREEAERLERERIEKERIERERKERERIEAEIRAREEAERLARERAERERLEAERRERERIEQERLETARLERERLERERLERERLERERIEAERKERERLERERIEAERKERERLETDRRERERLEAERRAREDDERRARERAEADRKERDRAEAERKERERADAERKERERVEAEKRAREQADAATDAQPGGSSRRRKRDRSARARKDKLRSVAPAAQAPKPATTPPAAPRAAAPAQRSWLVPPERAAAFEPPVPPAPVAPPVPAPLGPALAPAASAAPRSYPVYVPPADGGWTAPAAAAPSPSSPPPPAPPPPSPPAPPLAPLLDPAILAPAAGPIRLKSDSGSTREPSSRPSEPASPSIGLKKQASARSQPPVLDLESPWAPEPAEQPETVSLPWKAIAAAVVVLALAGAAYQFWGGSTSTNGPSAETPAAATHAAAAGSAVPASATGQISVTTEPPGAKVLVDGKPVGTSPVTVPDVAPGRHTVTLMADAGAVRRAVRVEAGETATVDVPIFSGFVEIAAPIVLQVSENGRAIGTSENQIMLTPGRHELRLTNKELNFVTTQTVEIQPGEGHRVQVSPTGIVNINALPWAEVWIDGVKAGDTPLANLPITLGVREIVFRHPQFGERKVTATITSGSAATVTMDFNKQ